jgi:hypothetical protein
MLRALLIIEQMEYVAVKVIETPLMGTATIVETWLEIDVFCKYDIVLLQSGHTGI